jgi:catechol 2,3-dioxygenase-like lactoylglutathione lyase family enzyme
MEDFIAGIQQVGIGVKNAEAALHYYAQLFNMQTLVFNDTSEASLMTRYTGGKVFKRQALLSLNLKGGGGFEIWQFCDRTPHEPVKKPEYGDLGIYAPKIKCADLPKMHARLKSIDSTAVSAIQTMVPGDQFYYTDAHGNTFNLVTGSDWFRQNSSCSGGVSGAVIGVRDMNKSLQFYRWLLNASAPIDDVIRVDQKGDRYRVVRLVKRQNNKGAFGKLLGSIDLELVQSLDRTPSIIYANRFWGDCGFIHLCFDVFDMCGLKKSAANHGYTFTIDSHESFAMEGASGRFCYIEDPDGTLMELVETHRVPIFKKLGLYLDLKKRGLSKPLPDWMIGLLALNKVKQKGA